MNKLARFRRWTEKELSEQYDLIDVRSFGYGSPIGYWDDYRREHVRRSGWTIPLSRREDCVISLEAKGMALLLNIEGYCRSCYTIVSSFASAHARARHEIGAYLRYCRDVSPPLLNGDIDWGDIYDNVIEVAKWLMQIPGVRNRVLFPHRDAGNIAFDTPLPGRNASELIERMYNFYIRANIDVDREDFSATDVPRRPWAPVLRAANPRCGRTRRANETNVPEIAYVAQGVIDSTDLNVEYSEADWEAEWTTSHIPYREAPEEDQDGEL